MIEHFGFFVAFSNHDDSNVRFAGGAVAEESEGGVGVGVFPQAVQCIEWLCSSHICWWRRRLSFFTFVFAFLIALTTNMALYWLKIEALSGWWMSSGFCGGLGENPWRSELWCLKICWLLLVGGGGGVFVGLVATVGSDGVTGMWRFGAIVGVRVWGVGTMVSNDVVWASQ